MVRRQAVHGMVCGGGPAVALRSLPKKKKKAAKGVQLGQEKSAGGNVTKVMTVKISYWFVDSDSSLLHFTAQFERSHLGTNGLVQLYETIDGAAALVLVSREKAKNLGLQVLARTRGGDWRRVPLPGGCHALQPLGGGVRREARRLRRIDDRPVEMFIVASMNGASVKMVL
ncbi:hypothetical protein CFC21_001453 [Triticum aestivum]|uniref:Uncharacterized protein n=1 Tax=Triticum aestivum TaxID=4565 RepID=A0A3B5XXB6_WHEAT|nr:hypothetical protein CFC21_001453 [Triticum aestivum]